MGVASEEGEGDEKAGVAGVMVKPEEEGGASTFRITDEDEEDGGEAPKPIVFLFVRARMILSLRER